jgi:CheY-like chemotaxis protein
LLVDAADRGVTLGRLYVDVVRPVLERAGAVWSSGAGTATDRLAVGSVQAALAVVAGRPVEGAAMRGEGRQALVSVGAAVLDSLDGQVIVDVLCSDGWTVTEVAAGTDAEQVAQMAGERHVQLVVMPTSNAADLLLSAATYTLLRRMPDPPVIVACAFGRATDDRRARAAGADAFVNDPDDLLRYIDRCLPTHGTRNWGVRLRRLGETLVVAPTGDLDAGSVRRLRQVVDSRVGSFESLVIDGRDVASVDGDGARTLREWLLHAAEVGRSHRVLPGPLLEAAYAGEPLESGLRAEPHDAGA